MKTLRTQRAWLGTAVAIAMLALVAVVPAGRAYASEAKADFSLQLRLIETSQGNGRQGDSMTGAARIEVLVEAFRATDNIQLSISRPDGSTWEINGRPFELDDPAWSDPGGEPQEPGADGQSVSARGAILTTIVVPLRGAAIHEIVVNATGVVDGQPVKAEGVVRAVLGVTDNQPVDDGTRAHFGLKEVE